MQEHGFFKIEIIKQTLSVEYFDAWNIETALRYCAEFKYLAEKINNNPWACLLDLSQWELGILEMMDEVRKLNEWTNINNQKYEAVVCRLSLQKWLMASTHRALTNVEIRFFDNRKEAQDWLNSVI
ncbi:MAG: STAS/SEC14 domain-containing protein [Psychromonas sp.]